MKNLCWLLLSCIILISSCKKDDDDNDLMNDLEYGLGWAGDDKTDTIPVSVNANTFGFGNSSTPSSHDITTKFPPIGDQGQFGTCVSWAVGYNYKTFLEGVDRNSGTSELAQASNQLSPKDLYLAIDDNAKSGCDGTNFTTALDVLLNRGVATFQTVPYTNLGNCSKSNLQASWNTEAAGHKINNYRKIDVNASTIKTYVSDDIPVIFGARLGDNFMTWNSDQVITSHSGFDNVGIHAYHAMVISGYDDSKGPNGAFRVVNSWGGSWGDVGYIWIDYNFFVTDFCFGGNCYVAANGQGDNNPPDVNPTITGAVDLAPWAFADYSTNNYNYQTERVIEYNVYNIGDQTAFASSNWALYYVYYNAYNANDYGVLFYNEFNTNVQVNTYNCPTSDHCIINTDLASGQDFAFVFNGGTFVPQTYYVPNLNGYYYLLLFADATESIAENDEQNNYFYTTAQYPAFFQNGYTPKKGYNGGVARDFKFENKQVPTEAIMKSSPFNSAVSQSHPNAYSLDEIKQMIIHKKENGDFQAKLNALELRNRDNNKSDRGDLR